ncbi:MAG: DUF4286 family protein [Cyclobacteriaceae bacterium]|nr:DUF4286 family protein [Cyclobacteriaceae bacterium]
MILYNITYSVDADIEAEWINWMKQSHIPNVLKTGRFEGYKFLRLLNEEADTNGVTYALQFFAQTIGDLESYLSTEAPALQKAHMDKYGSRFVAFRTLLEEI